MTSWKIALLDNERLFLNLLKRHFKDSGFDIVFASNDTRELLDYLASGSVLPDLLIMDAHVGPLNGYELTKELQNNWPLLKIMVVSNVCTPYSVANLIANNIRGYITKSDDILELEQCMASVLSGGEHYSKFVLDQMFIATIVKPYMKGNLLKDEEVQYLKFCCSDMPYKEIAAKMKTTQRILELYRIKIFAKLGIKTREGMMLFAIKNAIVKLN